MFKGCIFFVKQFALWRNHVGCIKISLECFSSFSLRMWFSCGCKIPLLWIQSATAHVETATTTPRKSAESNISPFLPFVCDNFIYTIHTIATAVSEQLSSVIVCYCTLVYLYARLRNRRIISPKWNKREVTLSTVCVVCDYIVPHGKRLRVATTRHKHIYQSLRFILIGTPINTHTHIYQRILKSTTMRWYLCLVLTRLSEKQNFLSRSNFRAVCCVVKLWYQLSDDPSSMVH